MFPVKSVFRLNLFLPRLIGDPHFTKIEYALRRIENTFFGAKIKPRKKLGSG